MEYLCKIQPSLHLSLHRPSSRKPLLSPPLLPKSPSSKTLFCVTPSKTPKPFSLKASSSNHDIPSSRSLKASSSNHDIPSSRSSLHLPPFSTEQPLPLKKHSFVKTISISLVTAAALLFARFSGKPAFAAVPATSPPPTVDSSSSDAGVESMREKETSLEQKLVYEPDDVRSLKELMETKVQLQKIAEAIDIIDRLIALEPNDREWPLLRAHFHLYGGDVDTATSSFEEIIAADPFRVEGYHGIAMVAMQFGSDDKLEELLKRIERVMGRCRKENKKALREFKLLEAQVRVIQENYEEALKVYEALVKEDPTDFRPYLCQGIIYALLRKMDEADKQFEKYRRLVPRGHPYADYFNENVLATKVFSQMRDQDEADSRR